MIPLVAKENLAEAVDVFCEGIAFSVEQCERVFIAAKAHGLKIKGHMDQLSNLGGSSMAAKHEALSVDHLEYLSEKDILNMKNSRTVAVLLPGAYYTLREKQKPPVEVLRKHGIPIAVATDCNPGSSPIASLRMAMNFACVLYGLSPAEALIGVTRNAAKALDRHTRIGILRPGFDATFCVWDVSNPVAIVSDLTQNPLRNVVVNGEVR